MMLCPSQFVGSKVDGVRWRLSAHFDSLKPVCQRLCLPPIPTETEEMRPLLDKPISFRISEDEHLTYSQAAADLGLSLSAYLRLRLVSVGEEYVADQIAQLRLTLLDNIPAGDMDGSTTPMILELLLLLRNICKPGDVRMARTELQRLGYTPWAPVVLPSN